MDTLEDDVFSAKLVDHIPDLRGFARSLRGGWVQADDLVQDALIKAWQARASFQAGTNMRAWLFTILRNQFYTGLRRMKFEGMPQDPDVSIPLNASQNDHVELKQTWAAMQRLPAERREALVLVGAMGHSYEEAAEICGCKVGTIKSRVHRARVELLAILEGTQDAVPEADKPRPRKSGANLTPMPALLRAG